MDGWGVMTFKNGVEDAQLNLLCGHPCNLGEACVDVSTSGAAVASHSAADQCFSTAPLQEMSADVV